MGKTNDLSGDFPDNFAAGASFRNLSKICTIFCGNGVCPDNCESTVFSLGFFEAEFFCDIYRADNWIFLIWNGSSKLIMRKRQRAR